MNRYRELTIDILENQARLVKQISFDLRASTFTAHHAENTFKESQKQLHSIHSLQAQKIALKAQVDSLTIDCLQLKVAADHQKILVEQSIKDTAIFAKNIQLASNTITRLAADAGSILSIIQAADNNSQIYQLAKEASTYTNETADLAAMIAQHGMVVSAYSSEIITGALADKTELISLLLHNIANQIPIDISLINETEQAQVLASTDRQPAKSILENNTTQYKAAEKAYTFMNLQLNMNLHVHVQQETNSFTVSFHDYQHPFKTKAPKTTMVSAYCIFLVKEKSKDKFSLEQAEQLLQNKNQCIEIPSQDITTKKITKVIKTTEILDGDQEPFQLNENYVVYVLTVFSDDFKKSRNTFDNDLSAPSEVFVFPSKVATERSTKAMDFIYTLTRQVEDAEYDVNYKQLVVNTQQATNRKHQDFLALAKNVEDNALSNKNQINLLASHALELKENSEKALNKISETLVLTQKVAEDIRSLLNKLFFSAEMSQKLHNTIVRQKSLNPLISDDLLSMLATAVADSNNAVELTLTALKSTFTGVSSCMKSDAALNVECKQSALFSKKMNEGKEVDESIITMTSQALDLAQSIYKKASMDDKEQSKQVGLANSDLSQATTKLQSLQAGLSAAKAAAGLLV